MPWYTPKRAGPATAPDLSGYYTREQVLSLLEALRLPWARIDQPPAVVTEAEAEAGTEPGVRLWPPLRVKQAIGASTQQGQVQVDKGTATSTNLTNGQARAKLLTLGAPGGAGAWTVRFPQGWESVLWVRNARNADVKLRVRYGRIPYIVPARTLLLVLIHSGGVVNLTGELGLSASKIAANVPQATTDQIANGTPGALFVTARALKIELARIGVLP